MPCLIICKLQRWWKKFSRNVFEDTEIPQSESIRPIKHLSMEISNSSWLSPNDGPEQRQCIVRSSSAMEHINEMKGKLHISVNRSSSLRYLFRMQLEITVIKMT